MRIYNERGVFIGDVNLVVRYYARPDALVEPCDSSGRLSGVALKQSEFERILKAWGLEGLHVTPIFTEETKPDV